MSPQSNRLSIFSCRYIQLKKRVWLLIVISSRGGNSSINRGTPEGECKGTIIKRRGVCNDILEVLHIDLFGKCRIQDIIIKLEEDFKL